MSHANENVFCGCRNSSASSMTDRRMSSAERQTIPEAWTSARKVSNWWHTHALCRRLRFRNAMV